MVGVDSHGFIFCGDDDGAAGKMIGFSEQASGTLLDSGNGCFIEDVVFNPCDGEVVIEVLLHLLTSYAFEVAIRLIPINWSIHLGHGKTRKEDLLAFEESTASRKS